jgi:hypothetical protein
MEDDNACACSQKVSLINKKKKNIGELVWSGKNLNQLVETSMEETVVKIGFKRAKNTFVTAC